MVAKFEREHALAEMLIQRLGRTAERYVDPNEAGDETGADVIAIVGDRRVGIQVTELDTGELAGQARASEKEAWRRSQECGHSTYGSWAQSDPAKLIAAIARAVTSKTQQVAGCDESWLLISASLPRMGALASTFVITQWLPADALNAPTVDKLSKCSYSHAFVHVIVGEERALYVWSPGENWRKEATQSQVAERAKGLFELRANPSELQEWLTDPDGKLDREIEKVRRDFAEARRKEPTSDELQRVSELRDYSIGLQSAKAYFRADDDKLTNPHKRKFFVSLQRELQGLDAEAWEFLKGEVLPRLKAQHPTRGWQQLFDTLNEAKGYNYLRRTGCKDVKFIPRAKTENVQTPDLRGFLGSVRILCEVKTINVSDDEANRLASGGVGTTPRYLEQPFLDKLVSVIKTAASQLLTFDKNLTSRRIVYMVFNFDDRIHEYAGDYQMQIESFLAGASLPNVEVVLEIKPPFHLVA